MKRLFATTALVAALASTAYADTHTTPVMGTALIVYQMETTTDLAASDLIGMRVYATENEVENDMTIAAGGEAEWNDIGEINELFLTREGSVAAVILGVGGFLGLGEKDVAVDMSQIRIVNEEGDRGEFFLVINSTQSELESAPAFVREDDMASTAMDQNAMEPMGFTPPMIEREGYMAAERADLTSETLTGASVFGVNDEDIGSVSGLTLTADGAVEDVIIDVGGFIGIGTKPIAVSFDELRILRTEDGRDWRVYIDATQEDLEARSSYTG